MLGRPAVDGWRVIWSEVGGRRRVQTQRMVDLRRPTVQRRRVLGPVGDRWLESDELATVRLPNHVLAWTDVTKGDNSGRLMIGRLGRRPRVLVRKGVRTVRVQDGRTLVWTDESGRRTYIDMARLPRRDGCPVRSLFNRVVLANRLLVVTEGAYGGDYRICWRASGRDDVAVQSAAEVSYSFAAAGEHVLIQTRPWDKYQTCDRRLMGVGVFNARLQQAERPHVDLGCADYSPVVLAGTGAAAWITTINATDTLQVLGPDGTVGNLDTGPAGSLGALAATDTTFTWTHDGQPRSSPAT